MTLPCKEQLDEANSVISTQLSDLNTAADKIADLQAQIVTEENAQKNSETETTAPAATDASDTDDQQDSTAALTATNAPEMM